MPTARGREAQRVRQLAREQRKQRQHQINNAWYSFVARPTCPPSTSMHVQGGTCITAKSLYYMDDVGRTNGTAWTVPNLQRDLTDPDEARVDTGWLFVTGEYTEVSWSISFGYRGGILLLLLPDVEENPSEGDWRLRLKCYAEEYGTAGEAEARLIAWLDESDPDSRWDTNYWPDPAYYDPEYQESGMPLCGVILRNDGTTGSGRHFMAIDALNRGRSYTWPRDMRPQKIALY